MDPGGITECGKKLLEERNTLLDDMGKKLSDVKSLDRMIRSILFQGKKIPYNPDDEAVHSASEMLKLRWYVIFRCDMSTNRL